MVLAGLVVAMLSSCAQSTASENAPRENADEETTSLEEGTTGEEIAATAVPRPVHGPAVQPTQNTSTGPAVGVGLIALRVRRRAGKLGLHLPLAESPLLPRRQGSDDGDKPTPGS